MIVTTTQTIEGKRIVEYLQIINGEAIMGANIVRDLFASITDIVGGVDIDYEVIREGMLMVAVSGTAVRVE